MLDTAQRPDLTSAGARARGLSRRQLLHAGVWAAPAVVLATAVPAAATSQGILKVTSITAATGTGTWTVAVTLQANEAATGAVSLSSPNHNVSIQPASRPFTLAGAGSATVQFTVTVSDNGNKTLTAVPVAGSIPAANQHGLSASFKSGSTISASQAF